MTATLHSNNTTEFAAIVHRIVTRAARAHPSFAARLERAERVVLRPNQPVVLYTDGSASVRSECDPRAAYQVVGDACSCPDAEHRERICKHALASGLYRRAMKELRDEQQRQRDYGTTYVAPGTPGQCCPCKACGITAVLDAAGFCRECGAETRFCLTALGAAALAVGVA
jgi:hypothetical protein